MSKDIVIVNNGTGAEETWQAIDEIETRGIGRGAVNWVPEDSTIKQDKTIVLNGTYAAADEGLYGYGNVNVNVQCMTGTIDGVEYFIYVDANGNIIQTPTGG